MQSKLSRYILPAIFFCVVLLSGYYVFGNIYSESVRGPLSVMFEMKKNVFKVREPVQGTITVNNHYPAGIPVVFRISLFHNEKPVSELMTAIHEVPYGKTKFSFKEFGIPQFNSGPEAQGLWRLRIIQQNADPASAREITLSVVPAEQK